ncbi:MAG TPA: mannonate dehydratase, partial [Anaerolineae bacterium]|nr:mannonate dehydratase [Anaerolineae bacterium]
FGKRNKIFQVHYRNNWNITSPTHYYEAFPDNGFVDMFQVMKALRDTGYKGVLVDEHIPGFVNSSAGNGVNHSYSSGYMRAMLESLDSISKHG